VRKVILSLILLFPISFGVYFEGGNAEAAKELQAEKHRISENEAKKIALKQVEGEIIGVELEKDDGITRYEVKIKRSNNIYEVEIDANTGKIVEVEREGPNDDDDDGDEDIDD
jgi:uncharacterized membrane protein YkoI